MSDVKCLTLEEAKEIYPVLLSKVNFEEYGVGEDDDYEDEYEDDYDDNVYTGANEVWVYEVERIPGTDIVAIPTMWADMAGDASSNIAATDNVVEVSKQEYGQGDNMTATVNIYRVVEGSTILVYGQNGDSDPFFTLYKVK